MRLGVPFLLCSLYSTLACEDVLVHLDKIIGMQGEPLKELPSSTEDSIQSNVDVLLARIMSARMQNSTTMEDEAEWNYRYVWTPENYPNWPSAQLQ